PSAPTKPSRDLPINAVEPSENLSERALRRRVSASGRRRHRGIGSNGLAMRDAREALLVFRRIGVIVVREHPETVIGEQDSSAASR
ncbi:hypothetical protein, partial [Methylobacterium soli]|uniref:hypothetical protein n=1 Tax=Methylobacterium soli TaxID=553447 RepID=UPI001EE2256B